MLSPTFISEIVQTMQDCRTSACSNCSRSQLCLKLPQQCLWSDYGKGSAVSLCAVGRPVGMLLLICAVMAMVGAQSSCIMAEIMIVLISCCLAVVMLIFTPSF